MKRELASKAGFAGLSISAIAFGIFSIGNPETAKQEASTPKTLSVVELPANHSFKANTIGGKKPEDSMPENHEESFCGAKTRSGKSCLRKTANSEKCWQHKPKPLAAGKK